MNEQIQAGDTVQVVMMKGLLDQINALLKSSGWSLNRVPALDDAVEDPIPTFLAVAPDAWSKS